MVLTEIRPDGTTKDLIDATCSAYVLAVAQDQSGELRLLTDHAGPPGQRRTALSGLTAHIQATLGLGR